MNDDEYARLLEEYERTFGEQAPTMLLPADEGRAAALLRQAIDTRDATLIERQIPTDAEA